MRTGGRYLPRRAAGQITEALADTRIVALNGARQVGKSTLAEVVLRSTPNGVIRSLDNPLTRTAAIEDPIGFIRHDGLMLIDEVQRAPELWLTMKESVDRDTRPGRFLLTGSARLLALRSIPDALPGRAETIELWPLSQGEIDDGADDFVDAAFTDGARLRVETSELRRAGYLDRARRGGYPEAVDREAPRRRARFFDAYIADILSRDIRQVADIERGADMRTLIALLGEQTAGPLNLNRLAGALSISAPTVRTYVEILETIFLVRRIPGWSANATTRAVATPKLIFTDSGIAAHLAAGGQEGAVLENFVLGELARQLTWSDTWAELYHYRDRDRDQYEVDAVLEDRSGRVIGIEVNASETVRSDDFRGLRLLQRRLGDRFHAGFGLYCGDQQLSFGDGLACLPISALWTAGCP